MKENKPQNPHPILLTDEVSGTIVPNSEYYRWKEGADAMTAYYAKQECDTFADFLIEHYESQKQVKQNGQLLGSNYNVGALVTLYAMIYNFGARFKCKKAVDYFHGRSSK